MFHKDQMFVAISCFYGVRLITSSCLATDYLRINIGSQAFAANASVVLLCVTL